MLAYAAQVLFRPKFELPKVCFTRTLFIIGWPLHLDAVEAAGTTYSKCLLMKFDIVKGMFPVMIKGNV